MRPPIVGPLATLERRHVAPLVGVLFDLDDTMLDEGRLAASTYGALERLRCAGLRAGIVTGRPASWGRTLARLFPVDLVVTENGSIAHAAEGRDLRELDDAGTARAARRARLLELAERTRLRFPELRWASDAGERLSDVTFDVGESRTVARELVTSAAQHLRAAGARAVASSVHLHATLDPWDKASGALAALRWRFDTDPTHARHTWAFVGDSDNDAPAFAAFRCTFAPTNRTGAPSVPPRWDLGAPSGAGVVALVERLVELRRGAPA